MQTAETRPSHDAGAAGRPCSSGSATTTIHVGLPQRRCWRTHSPAWILHTCMMCSPPRKSLPGRGRQTTRATSTAAPGGPQWPVGRSGGDPGHSRPAGAALMAPMHVHSCRLPAPACRALVDLNLCQCPQSRAMLWT